MKIHLVPVRQEAYDAMVNRYSVSEPRLHELVEDPEAADMILFVGGLRSHPDRVLDSPLPKKYPEKTFIFGDEDGFVPLLPGVYPNAEKPRLWDLKRYDCSTWIHVLNPYTKPMEIEKKYLFSFMGGSTCILRKKFYKVKYRRQDVVVENTSNYYHWDPSQSDREQRQRRYAEVIAASKFGIVPRGASAGTLRLWDVMEIGVAPVVISDRWLLPSGPDWSKIAVRVPERKLKQLDTILEQYESEYAERGRRAREAYLEWFAPPVFFNRLVEACEKIKAQRRIPERWIQPFWRFMLWRMQAKDSARAFFRSLVLGAFKLMGRKFVYEINER